MLSPAYASLLVIIITSQNALGSCQLRSCIELGEVVLSYTINRLNPVGNKGIMSNCIIQSVSIDALSASSISSDSETSSLTRSILSSMGAETLKFGNDTPVDLIHKNRFKKEFSKIFVKLLHPSSTRLNYYYVAALNS